MTYSLSNFEPYPPLRKHLGNLAVLVWSKQNGYQFMNCLDRAKALLENLDYKIVAVEKI